ncbi:MAG: DegT/DnrJ/EryC1/StrS family aminotransferase [Butyrivibrio sp.]|nr:DegT/DnrJ/EryC1/StrS family aminotransferase [Butyrivibrio sp.]
MEENVNKTILITQSSMPPYEEYIEMIKPLWESHWLTNMGNLHKELEESLKKYLDVPELSLMVNGHTSLELALQMFDFPEGSEVITSPFTFISTTHAIVRNRLKPVFCDIKASDGTIDEDKIENLISDKTVAILPIHVYGNICNVEKIQQIADKYDLKVIYDAAHAFGIKCNGIGVGNFGDASIFSFHATKVFNTIEGGAVAIKERRLYEKLYNLKNFGIRGEELIVGVGCNAKMNEFAAAMGICNMRHMDEAISGRQQVDEIYRSRFENTKGIRLFDRREDADKNFAYFPIVVEDDYPISRNELYDKLKENKIFSRKYFYPLTADQACFRNKYKDVSLEVARYVSDRILTIPIYEKLSEEDANRIADIICGK